MSSSRADNISVAVEAPGGSRKVPGESTPTSELSDLEFVQSKYCNFRGFVRGLVPQEPKLCEWGDWLDKLPLAVFLAGGDQELKGVREALTEEQRKAEADLVLQRWSLQYGFDLSKITPADIIRLTRYLLLFSSC